MTKGDGFPSLPLLAGLVVAAACTPAFGAGFALIEQSASGQGNAFAGAAAVAGDASTIFFNPAGLTRLEDPQVLLAFHGIFSDAKFRNNGSTGNPVFDGTALGGPNDDGGGEAFVPNLYVSIPLSDTLVAGFGISAPFGLETRYSPDWVGRYHAIRSDLATVNLNPTLAWQATDRLSVGIGIDAQYIRATLSNAIDFGLVCVSTPTLTAACNSVGITAAQQSDGIAELTGDDWSWGYNLGLLFDVTDDLRVGLAYRSKIKHNLRGGIDYQAPANPFHAAVFNAVPNFQDRAASAGVTLPETVSLSAAWEASEDLEVLADVTWTRWSRFRQLVAVDDSGTTLSSTDENWENVYRYSLGLNYHYNDAWTLRAGVAYDEEPIPDAAHRTPRIPGNDRKWLSVGFGYAVNPDTRIDVGYSHLFISDPSIQHVDSQGHTLSGTYDNSVDILSAQFSLSF